MDDQFVTVVLPPDEKRFRVSKRQPLTVVTTTGSLLKHESNEKKEFTLPGCIPTFEELPSSSSTRTSAPRGLHPSQKYVQYRGKEVETDAEDAVEYDLDREDCVWLRMANERRRHEGRKPLSESLMERCIDRLEKESHFQLAKSAAAGAATSKSAALFHLRPHHLDSDVPCCICNDDDTSDANLIIFCDMCNIAVHQECYGVPYIPEGQWLCRRCQLSPSAPVKCALCPFTNGAFKQTSDGQWAHVICAIWLSEVHFANTAFLEPIEGVSHSLNRRCKLRCLVCKRKGGACLQCSKRSCCRMRMVIQEDRDRKTNAMIINRYAYCHKHSVSATEQDEISKAAYKRSVDEQLRKARRQLVTCNREVPQVSIPVIPPKKVNAIRAELGVDSMDDVCHYWALKRRSRCGVPLIRRLQVYHTKKALGQSAILGGTSTESAGSETETSMAGAVSRNGVRLQPEHLYAHRLRSDLEKVRLLCELVRKREKIKREYVHTTETMLLKWTKPISQILAETIDKLEEKDHQSVFAVPVRDEDVKGYSAIIQNPMAFSTMRDKLASYKRIADLRQDFQLMMTNCDTFNRQNPHFWSYGNRIRRIGMKVIKAAEEEERTNSTPWLLEHLKSVSLLGDAEYAQLAERDVTSTVSPKKSINASTSEPKSEILPNHSTSRRQKRQARVPSTTAADNGVDSEPTRKRRKQKGKEEKGSSDAPLKSEFATPLAPVMNGQIETPALHAAEPNGVNTLKSLRDSYRKSIDSTIGMRGRTTRQGYITEISSASDTAGTSSMDEDLEPRVVRLERSRRSVAAGRMSLYSNGDADHINAEGFGELKYM